MAATHHAVLRVWLLSSLLIAGLLHAQEPAQPTPGEKRATSSLKATILDLKYEIQDLTGAGKGLSGGASGLASIIQDLRAKETATEIRIELAADVLFLFDKADIRPAAQGALKQVASVIRERAKGQVRIQGHTDAKGSDAYNERLSTRRADAVKAWLVSKEGLGQFAFATQGFGAKRPVASNTKPDGSDDPEGRQKNRRVEIVVTK